MNLAVAQELGKDSRLLIAGTSSLKIKNDRAVAWFSIAEEAKDKEVATSAVNKRAKLVLDQLRTDYKEVKSPLLLIRWSRLRKMGNANFSNKKL